MRTLLGGGILRGVSLVELIDLGEESLHGGHGLWVEVVAVLGVDGHAHSVCKLIVISQSSPRDMRESKIRRTRSRMDAEWGLEQMVQVLRDLNIQPWVRASEYNIIDGIVAGRLVRKALFGLVEPLVLGGTLVSMINVPWYFHKIDPTCLVV